jgi:hypothetical protein
LGASSKTATTVDVNTETPSQVIVATVSPKPVTAVTATPKANPTGTAVRVTAPTVRVYTPNGGEILNPGANFEIDTVVKMGTVGTLSLSFIDEKNNAFPLGTFKIDPKIEVQRSNIYITTKQAVGKYKILASLYSNGVTVTDVSDDYFSISK